MLDLLTADYTFLNERLAQALRHPGRVRQPLPARDASPTRRAAACSARQHPDGDVARRIAPRRSCAASGCSTTCSARRRRRRRRMCRRSTKGRRPQPQTMRERMEQHRASPACASCHRMMDPIGLALENFDAIGAWRTDATASSPIDASGAALGRHPRRRSRVAAPGAARSRRERVRRHGDREAADLRAGPQRRVLRHAGGSGDRPPGRRRDYRWSSLVLGVVDEPAVSDAAAAQPACQCVRRYATEGE